MLNKNKIVQYYDAKALQYERSADVQPLIAQRLAVKCANLSPSTVLEIGAGTGLLSEALLVFFPKAQFLLTDIAPAMVAVTAARFQSVANVRVACMDGEALALSDTFDLITSSMTLHWFVNLSQSLARLKTHLRPGGHLRIALLGRASLQEWVQWQGAAAGIIPFPDVSTLQSQFPDFQFTVETIQQPYTSAEHFLHTLKNIGAHAPSVEYQPLSAGKLRRLLREINAAHPEGIRMTYEVIYAEYQRP